MDGRTDGHVIHISPNGPFAWHGFFIKTGNAGIAFFFLSFPSLRFFFPSSPFPSLLWLWSFSGLKKPTFDAFSLKWLQISLGWFSKNWLYIYIYIYIYTYGWRKKTSNYISIPTSLFRGCPLIRGFIYIYIYISRQAWESVRSVSNFSFARATRVVAR